MDLCGSGRRRALPDLHGRDHRAAGSPGLYADSLEELGLAIDPHLRSGLRSGFTFVLQTDDPSSGWSCAAWPVTYQSTGVRSFRVDETGLVRGMDIGGGIGDEAMLRVP